MDLASSDPQRSQDFYARLFGWTVQEMGPDLGNYVNFSKNGVLVAGLVPNPQPDSPDGWTTYLSSPDAKAAADATLAAEGRVLLEPMPVMSLGSMAVVTDPSGGVIGVWQPEQHRGYGLSDEDGTPVWSELHTHDYSAAVRFYQQVFGWETVVMSDTAELRYTVFEKDGLQYAGIMDAAEFLPADIPSNWQVYFQADDVDATLARAKKHGAKIPMAAEDIPGVGRFGILQDPTGAILAVMKPLPRDK